MAERAHTTTSRPAAGGTDAPALPGAGGGHTVGIEHVTRRFDEVVAVDDVSLDVAAGEFLSILGPSGCGKTTLLRILAGLDFADAGRILIDGRDVTDVPAHKRPTNLVFQRGALFPHKTVFENVAYPLQRQRRPAAEIRERVAETVALVRLQGFDARRPSQLSGGQAQRVALARALVSRPAVLLLDEPLAALDLLLRKEMQLELRRLQERLGTTFVFVTHDQEEALTMSSRIVIMRDGSIVQAGSPREIYDNPASVFASTFIGESNLLTGEVLSSDGDVAVVSVAAHRLRAREARLLEPGAAVVYSARPERIGVRTGSAPAEGSNVLAGTVLEVIFIGNRVRVRVDCGGATVWAEEAPDSPVFEVLREGMPVDLVWRVDDGRVILPDGG